MKGYSTEIDIHEAVVNNDFDKAEVVIDSEDDSNIEMAEKLGYYEK